MSTDDIDFLDSLEPDPPSKPKPALVPAVTLPSVSPRVRGCLEIVAVVVVTVAFTVGLTAWWIGGNEDAPVPSANAVELGRSFGPILAGTLADGFEEGSTQLRAGKSLSEADVQLKAVFDKARKAAFDQHVGGSIHGIVEDGKELEPSQREAMIGLFDGFAKGLRETK